MSHPLTQLVRSVSRTARRLMVCRALAAVIVMSGVAIAVAGSADFAFRIDDVGSRVMLSAAVLTIITASACCFFLPIVRASWRDIDVARSIESSRPEFEDQLSSAIEFLHQPSGVDMGVSWELRQEVVRDALARAEQVSLSRVVNRVPCRRMVRACCMVVSVALLTSFVMPGTSLLIAKRLSVPWGPDRWPNVHDLRFEGLPSQLAQGSDLELVLTDGNGQLPDEVKVHYRFQGQPESAGQTRSMRYRGGRMVHRIENVTRNLRLRAEGGDDYGMAWQLVRVTEPPTIKSMTIRLIPPAYTGWTERSQTVTHLNLRLLQGTKVSLSGRASKPLASAELRMSPGQSFNGVLSPDGLEFRLSDDGDSPLAMTQSCRMSLDVIDTDGFHRATADPWDVQVLVDRPPTVSIKSSQIHSLAVSKATVPLAIVVHDDVAIHSVQLMYSRSEQSPTEWRRIELLRQAAAPSVPMDLNWDSAGETHAINFDWELSEIAGLTAGSVITFKVQASDYERQVGESVVRRLSIVTDQELKVQIGLRYAQILARVRQVVEQQRLANQSVTRLLSSVMAEEGQGGAVIDRIQGAQLNQREVEQQLIGDEDSVSKRLSTLMEYMEDNGLDSDELLAQTRNASRVVIDLSVDQLPEVEYLLEKAQRLLRAEPRGKVPHEAEVLSDALSAAARLQDEITQNLQELVGQLSRWEGFQQLNQSITRMLGDQLELQRRTEALRLRTLTRDEDALSQAAQADLGEAASVQIDLARRMENVQEQMRRMQMEAAAPADVEDQPSGLDLAVQLADELSIATSMRRGSREIQEYRLGKALHNQTRAVDGLKQLLSVVENGASDDRRGRSISRLRQVTRRLDVLRDQVADNRQRIEAALGEGAPDVVEQELGRQRQLADDLTTLANQLPNGVAVQAGRMIAAGAAGVHQSNQLERQGRTDAARQRLSSAQRQLEQAQRQLEDRLNSDQLDRARRQLEKLGDQVTRLVERQQATRGRTVLYERNRDPGRQLTAAELTRLRNLEVDQRELARDTEMLIAPLDDSRVFRIAIGAAASNMMVAADRLGNQDTGEVTGHHQTEALVRLQQLVRSLAFDQSAQPPSAAPEQQENVDLETGSPGNANAVQRLAELKLIRMMQERVLNGTLAIDEQLELDGQARELESRHEVLARQQGELAELIHQLASEGNQRINEPEPALQQPQLPSFDSLDQQLDDNIRDQLFPARSKGAAP